MIKKLFLTAKAMSFLIFIFVLIYQIDESIDSKAKVEYGDIWTFNENQSNPEISTNYYNMSDLEKNLIIADKNKSFSRFWAYNKHRQRDVMPSLLFLIAVVALEKWLFWLIKKEGQN